MANVTFSKLAVQKNMMNNSFKRDLHLDISNPQIPPDSKNMTCQSALLPKSRSDMHNNSGNGYGKSMSVIKLGLSEIDQFMTGGFGNSQKSPINPLEHVFYKEKLKPVDQRNTSNRLESNSNSPEKAKIPPLGRSQNKVKPRQCVNPQSPQKKGFPVTQYKVTNIGNSMFEIE